MSPIKGYDFLKKYPVQVIIFIGAIASCYLTIAALEPLVNNYYKSVLIAIGINVVMALGLNIITGVTGQLSLGHAAFMSIGAYAGALATLELNLPYPMALLIGGAVAAMVGVTIGYPILRLSGDYLAIATLGFAEIIRVVFNNLKITKGALGIAGIPPSTTLPMTWTIVVLVVIFVAWLHNSRNGRAFFAIREDEIAAEAMGINTTLYKVQAFGVGAFLAGTGGAMYAHYLTFIRPDNFGFIKSIEILNMVVLGGLGSIPGTILGASVLTLAPELLRVFADYRNLFYGALLVMMMVFRPNGLLGGVDITKAFLRVIPGKVLHKYYGK